jgi:dimethylargininase
VGPPALLGRLPLITAESLVALTRAVAPSLVRCELTHIGRAPIDVALAAVQHGRYEQALHEVGCQVRRLPPEPDLPDSVFVEDTAVVLDELAIITRPGAASRRPETISVADCLRRYRPVAFLEAPATLDGGDVLRLGRRLFVGQTPRSNAEGFIQFKDAVAPLGYSLSAMPIHGCLHLKSAVTEVAPDTLLLNPAWVGPGAFAGWGKIEVDPAEPSAANALRVGAAVLFPAAYPRTADRLRRLGIQVKLVDVSEIAKAEGGLTCCSILLRGSHSLATS